MNIGLIPARSGSKRIQGKNTRLFAGRPMIQHSIETALRSNVLDSVIVSTDDPATAEIAKSAGADVPFVRPLELSDDHTGLLAVIQHAIGWMRSEQLPVEYVCCVLATAPFLQPSSLASALEKLHASGASYAFSITEFAFPIQRAISLDDNERVDAMWPQYRDRRSQDLEPAYHDAAQFYWGTASAFEAAEPMFAPHSLGIRLPAHLVHDIDTESDWRRAELMYHALVESGELAS